MSREPIPPLVLLVALTVVTTGRIEKKQTASTFQIAGQDVDDYQVTPCVIRLGAQNIESLDAGLESDNVLRVE